MIAPPRRRPARQGRVLTAPTRRAAARGSWRDDPGLGPGLRGERAGCRPHHGGRGAVPAPRARVDLRRAVHRSNRSTTSSCIRLTLRVFCDTDLAAAVADWASADEVVARAGLEPGRATVPVSWMLRHSRAEACWPGRTRPAGRDSAPSRRCPPSTRRRWPPSSGSTIRRALPSYALAETAARDYPAFLRGASPGKEILFAPTRLPLWVGYFSNDNALYAVNNRVGAVAVAAWMPGRAEHDSRAGRGSGERDGWRCSSIWRAPAGSATSGRIGSPSWCRRSCGEGSDAFRRRLAGGPAMSVARARHQPTVRGAGRGGGECVDRVRGEHPPRRPRSRLHARRDPADARAGRAAHRVGVCPAVARGHALSRVRLQPAADVPVTAPAPRLPAERRIPHPRAVDGRPGRRPGSEDVRLLPDVARIREEFSGFYVAAIGATRPD